MKVIQLEKTWAVIEENRECKDLYFLRLKKYSTKNGSENYAFDSKRVRHATLDEIEELLNDPNFALIKIEESQ